MSRLFTAGTSQTLSATVTAFTSSSFSFGGWFKPNSAGGSNIGSMMVWEDGGAVQKIFLRHTNGSGGWQCVVAHATSPAQSDPNQTLANGVWHCIIVTYNSSDKTIRMFYGTPGQAMTLQTSYATQTAGVGAMTTGMTKLQLGDRQLTGFDYDGLIGPTFAVQRLVTLDDAERFRNGDYLGALYDGTTQPIFYAPSDSSNNVVDVANQIPFTISSVSYSNDNPPAGWSTGVFATERKKAVSYATITATHMADVADSVDRSTYTTSTYTPGAAGRLVLISITHRSGAGGTADSGTPTGACITGATLVSSIGLPPSGVIKTEVWRALSTSSAGTISIPTGSNTLCIAHVTEFTGVDTTTNYGVVQNATNSGSATTALSVTLAAFGNTANATFGAFGGSNSLTKTPKAGWTELHDDIAPGGEFSDLETQFIATNDTNPQATFPSNAAFGAVGIELKAAALVGDPMPPGPIISTAAVVRASTVLRLGFGQPINFFLSANFLPDTSGAWTATFEEALGLSDVLTQFVISIRTTSDVSGLLDSASQVDTAAQTAFDQLGLLDAASWTSVAAQSPSDSLGLLDVETQVATAAQTLADTLGMTDSTAQLAVAAQNTSDSLGMLDSMAAATAYARSPSDAVGLLDSMTQVGTYTQTFLEALGLLDSMAQSSPGAQSVSDSVGMLDTMTDVATYLQTVAESVGLTDSMTAAPLIPQTFSDAEGLLDTATRIGVYAQTFLDSLGETDLETTLYTALQTLTDNAGLLDSLTDLVAYSRSTSDAAGLTDSATPAATVPRTLADVLGLLDSSSSTSVAGQLVLDIEGLTDVATEDDAPGVILSEQLGLMDDAVPLATLSVALYDLESLLDVLASREPVHPGGRRTTTIVVSRSRRTTRTPR